MKLSTPSRKILHAVVVVVLVVEATGLAWLYLEYSDLSDELRFSAWSLATKSLRYLEGDVELLLHLLDENPDIHLMVLTARNAAEHASVTASALSTLHDHGGRDHTKTYVLGVAVSNIEAYLNTFANNPDKVISLKENKELLEEAASILKEIAMKYRQDPEDIPNSLISKLHKISEQLH